MPPSAERGEQQVALLLAVDEADSQQTESAEREAHAMEVATIHLLGQRHEPEGGEEGDEIFHAVAVACPLGAALEDVGTRVAAAEDHRHCVGEMQPHAEEAEPGEELHQREAPHRAWHVGEGVGDLLHEMHEAAALGLLAAEFLHVLRRLFLRRNDGPEHSGKERDGPM